MGCQYEVRDSENSLNWMLIKEVATFIYNAEKWPKRSTGYFNTWVIAYFNTFALAATWYPKFISLLWLASTSPLECTLLGIFFLYGYLFYFLFLHFRPLKLHQEPWGLLSSHDRYMDPSTFSDCKEYLELILEAKRLLSDLLPGTGVSEQLLLAPRKYQSLLEDARDEFRRQLLRLGYGDDKIDDFCEGLNRILAEAQKLLAMMWLLEALLNLLTTVITVRFFEFPNNIRPPCTTMPWIIVPALFVLWGVCWMFINKVSIFPLEDVDAEIFQGELIFLQMLYIMLIYVLEDFLSLEALEPDSFPVGPLEGKHPQSERRQNTKIRIDINLESLENLQDWNPTGEASFAPLSYLSPLDGPFAFEAATFAPQTFFPEKEPSYFVETAAVESPWQSMDNEIGFLVQQHQPDVISSTSTGFMTGIAEHRGHSRALFMPSPKDLPPSTSDHGTILPVAPEQDRITVDEASEHTIAASNIVTDLSVPQKKEFRCSHVGCETLTFKYESHLKYAAICTSNYKTLIVHRKHLDRHSRPFTCRECSKSFGAKKDLKRHQDTKHHRDAQVFCTVADCKRGQMGFSRRDNLLKHIHNVHEHKYHDKGIANLTSSTEGAATVPTKIARKRRREDDNLESVSREELIERLLEEQSKSKRLLHEMEQQGKKLEEELRVQRERYEMNEDRLWRMSPDGTGA